MARKAVYPGTFDPVTNGHLDLIARASVLFDALIVAVGRNIEKRPVFTAAERVAFLEAETKKYPHVRVVEFDGLVVEFARASGATTILRGIRTFSDFETELQMAFTNRSLAPEIETIFMPTGLQTSFLSSRLIKEAALLGADISAFVPPAVARALEERLGRRERA